MQYYSFVFVCVQIILLKDALALPLRGNTFNIPNSPTTVLSGTAAQVVAPEFMVNWPASAKPVPLVTEIVPNLQFGEINVDGDMPVGGMIKISGTFPVFGTVAVDGAVPSYGTAYVDSSNLFQSDLPLVTEIVPNLQFGEINVDGDMPVGGMIKISGTFPVFGTVAVDGAVPSYGTAYVDSSNLFQSDLPLVTEIVPNLQFGEINVDGDMPVGGMIKISGTFPVFGTVAVDGAVPSYGTAYVDSGNIFQSDCAFY